MEKANRTKILVRDSDLGGHECNTYLTSWSRSLDIVAPGPSRQANVARGAQSPGVPEFFKILRTTLLSLQPGLSHARVLLGRNLRRGAATLTNRYRGIEFLVNGEMLTEVEKDTLEDDLETFLKGEDQ